jgi:hypothetical protein
MYKEFTVAKKIRTEITTGDALATRPDLAAKLRHHELTTQQAEPIPDKESMQSIIDMANDLAEIKAENLKLRRANAESQATVESLRSKLRRSQTDFNRVAQSEQKLSIELDHIKALRSCQPFVIGGSEGYSPSTLDIHLEECHTTYPGILNGLPKYVAWIPVPLWPIPMNGKFAPTIGEVRIKESLSFPKIAIPTCDHPLAATDYDFEEVCVTAFARVDLKLDTLPRELIERVERRDQRENYDRHTDPAEHPSEMDAPPFIPSLHGAHLDQQERLKRINDTSI